METRSTWKAVLDCNSSSQTELAKVLPKDWNKLITEGSHTLTSSVRDLTCKSSQHKNKKVHQVSTPYHHLNESLSNCKQKILIMTTIQINMSTTQKKNFKIPAKWRLKVLLNSLFTHTWDNACPCYPVKTKSYYCMAIGQKVSQLLNKERWKKN